MRVRVPPEAREKPDVVAPGFFVPDGTVSTGAHPQTPRAFARRFALLQVTLIVHPFVEDTLHPDGIILVLLIENDVMPDLVTI